MVRRSQPMPQAPNWIVSVAWPNGMTCPCPQKPFAKTGHPLWAAGATGSLNVMLTGTVVAAIAGEARAVARDHEGP